MSSAVAARIKQYLLAEFLPGEDPGELLDDTPLITGGILDSIATIKIVSFLEEQFRISLAAHETDVEFLNTIGDMAALVDRKRGNT
jgi:acyl carrier protein